MEVVNCTSCTVSLIESLRALISGYSVIHMEVNCTSCREKFFDHGIFRQPKEPHPAKWKCSRCGSLWLNEAQMSSDDYLHDITGAVTSRFVDSENERLFSFYIAALSVSTSALTTSIRCNQLEAFDEAVRKLVPAAEGVRLYAEGIRRSPSTFLRVSPDNADDTADVEYVGSTESRARQKENPISPSLRTPPTTTRPADDVEFVVGSDYLLSAARLPHQRESCFKYKFSLNGGTCNQLYCDYCYCYICDAKASECTKWKKHCDAFCGDAQWKNKHEKRKRSREKQLQKKQRKN